MDIQSLLRENIRALTPYSTARDEYKGTAEVYLDANENPFPSGYNRYPDPHQQKLKEKISTLKNMPVKNIFLGNGSDEVIDLIIRAFCEPAADSILITEPTYGMYAVCANINNVPVKRALLSSGFDLDLQAINKRLDKSVKIIFLCSPNNPSGNLLNKEKVRSLITSFAGIVVIDEAYIDFANDAGFLPVLDNHANLIILQTFSKAWGLAGLRMGMAFASEEIVSVLNKIKFPYNINTLTQQTVMEKLSSDENKKRQVEIVITERNKLSRQLAGIPGVTKIFPSDANFILVRFNNAAHAYNQLLKQKIIVRDRSSLTLCEGCLRITVGTPEENTKLIETLKTL
ncbi:MAG: histidinol-phosphate transaminase [Flammeovirgaceae bacterium]|nr:MAG: histidinol-phosphate transaminase [Flammeovirgaceae bacterium]